MKQFNGESIDHPDQIQHLDFSLNNNLINKQNINDVALFLSDGLNLIFNIDKNPKSSNQLLSNFNADQIKHLLDKCIDMIASDFLAKYIYVKFSDHLMDKDSSKMILRLGTR